jgi:predicted MFS family arabinose efflux permease
VAVTGAGLGMGGVALSLVGGRSYDALLLVAAAVFGVGYGGVQNVTLVVAFHRAGAAGAPVASALWNAAFDSGTAMGAFAVGAVAATGLGLPWTMAVSAGLVLAVLPVALLLGRSRDPLPHNAVRPG